MPKENECPVGMEGKEFMMFSTPVWYGNSGGPIFDANGKVCGIVSWMFTQPRHFNFGVPSYVVQSELKKLTQ
jgi:S1-C subfamily serine protease